MQNIINNIKKYYKIFMFIILIPFILPLMSIVIEIIFNSGNLLGTVIRRLIEGGIC